MKVKFVLIRYSPDEFVVRRRVKLWRDKAKKEHRFRYTNDKVRYDKQCS